MRTIYSNFVPELRKHEKWLLDSSKVEKLLGSLEMAPLEPARFCLCIDAIKVLVFAEKKKNDDYAFIFQLTSIDCEACKAAVHVLPCECGQAGGDRLPRIEQVLRDIVSANPNVIIIYACTDGDHGYDIYHRQFIAEWWVDDATFEETIDKVRSLVDSERDLPIFIADMIHFAKNRRTDLLNDRIYMVPDQISSKISAENIANSYPLGDVLADKTPNGAMQDTYPIALFSIKVLLNVLANGHYGEGLFLLPTTLWFEVVRNERLNRETRLQMLEIAIRVFMRIHKEELAYEELKAERTRLLKSLKPKERKQLPPFPTIPGNFYSKPVQIVRALNTLTTLYVEIERVEELNFSHLSTMSEEHLNGQIRTACHGDDRLERVVNSVARLNVGVRYMEEMDIEYKQRKRDFTGGVTLTDDDFTESVDSLPSPEESVEALFAVVGFYSEMHNDLIVERLNELFTYLAAIACFAAPIKIPVSKSLKKRGIMIRTRCCL